jgi:hypothetical protein
MRRQTEETQREHEAAHMGSRPHVDGCRPQEEVDEILRR